LARATGEGRLNTWARELAQVAHRAFSAGAGARGLAWKMSIDLSRPLVPSMGHHDPLDGLITFVELQATAAALGSTREGPALELEVQSLAAMTRAGQWVTTDLL